MMEILLQRVCKYPNIQEINVKTIIFVGMQQKYFLPSVVFVSSPFLNSFCLTVLIYLISRMWLRLYVILSAVEPMPSMCKAFGSN